VEAEVSAERLDDLLRLGGRSVAKRIADLAQELGNELLVNGSVTDSVAPTAISATTSISCFGEDSSRSHPTSRRV
jgi:hypothetical protein